MTESFYSRAWHRVAALKPRLRPHVTIVRHAYRGQVWHVLDDRIGGRSWRFSPGAWALIGRMDGTRTLEEIWNEVLALTPEEAPTQDEVIQLVGQLYQADALEGDRLPDLVELGRRTRKMSRREKLMRYINPMALRFPLIDPDKFLTQYMPWMRPVFTLGGFLIWALIVLAAGALAVLNWNELTGNLADRVLAPSNLAVLILIYPVVKLLHELGHGFAAKRWGGEVHVIGVMLLVLMPVPYVDASAASAFPNKLHRMIVGAAGMMAELLIAAIAMFIWVAVEPGLIRAVCFNTMLIAGVSTVIFNGNPLLKFDGYYIFADWLGIPNLAQRSNQHLGWQLRRHVLRIRDEEPDADTMRERGWFLFYSIASFFYRMVVAFSIVFFIAGQMFFIGVLLAIWVVALMLVWPFIKVVKAVLSGQKLARYRDRGIVGLSGAIVAVFLVLFALPMPYGTVAMGLLWPSDDAIVRAGSSGRIMDVIAHDGAAVTKNGMLAVMENETFLADANRLIARRDELEAAHRAALVLDRAQAGRIGKELSYVRNDLAYAQERLARLRIIAPRSGNFVLPEGTNPLGRTLREGEVLGFIMSEDDEVRVRVLVPEKAASPRKLAAARPVVRFSERLDEVFAAEIDRVQPAATTKLPGPALAKPSGGWVAIDPVNPEEMRPVEPHFTVDVRLQDHVPLKGRAGERVYVRFGYEAEPIGFRLMRALRQLLLSRFTV